MTAFRNDSQETPPPQPPPVQEDEDVKHIVADERGQMIVGAGYTHWAETTEEAYEMNLLYGPPAVVSTRDYDVIRHIHTNQN